MKYLEKKLKLSDCFLEILHLNPELRRLKTECDYFLLHPMQYYEFLQSILVFYETFAAHQQAVSKDAPEDFSGSKIWFDPNAVRSFKVSEEQLLAWQQKTRDKIGFKSFNENGLFKANRSSDPFLEERFDS